MINTLVISDVHLGTSVSQKEKVPTAEAFAMKSVHTLKYMMTEILN